MKIPKSLFAIMFLLVFLITACGEDVNIRDTQIYYWRDKTGSPNAEISIDLVLKEYPSDLRTIYVENIIFTFKTGWTPHEKYLNGPFDIQTGDPKRFAFRLNGYTTVYLNQGIPMTAMFAYYKTDALLNVDDWIKRDSCPFEKIQLQGLSADAKVQLPDTLDIPFPCNLNSIKVCKRYDPFFGGCAEYAP